jgi:predicted DNA-binding transcriptional regulator AlpA
MQGLTEAQAAARAGFSRFSHFQRARQLGAFPRPIREVPGAGPLWSEEQVDRWLGQRNRRDQKQEALERLDAQVAD